MDLFDKLKQVRISKRARRGAVLGLCLCAAAGLGTHLLLGGGAPVGCTQEDLADTRAVMAVQTPSPAARTRKAARPRTRWSI